MPAAKTKHADQKHTRMHLIKQDSNGSSHVAIFAALLQLGADMAQRFELRHLLGALLQGLNRCQACARRQGISRDCTRSGIGAAPTIGLAGAVRLSVTSVVAALTR